MCEIVVWGKYINCSFVIGVRCEEVMGIVVGDCDDIFVFGWCKEFCWYVVIVSCDYDDNFLFCN